MIYTSVREVSSFYSFASEICRLKLVPVEPRHLDIDVVQLSPVPPNIKLPAVGNILPEAFNNKGISWREVHIQAGLVRVNEDRIKCNCIFDVS